MFLISQEESGEKEKLLIAKKYKEESSYRGALNFYIHCILLKYFE